MDPWRDFWPRYEAKRLERPLGALAETGIPGAKIAGFNRHHAIEALKGMTVHRHRVHLARKAVMESEKSALV
jgi:hypothetical protein